METTPWMKLYAACHHPAIITVTGLDYDCFAKLLVLFGSYFHYFTHGHWTEKSSQEVTAKPTECNS
jgi:hypothetical protein